MERLLHFTVGLKIMKPYVSYELIVKQSVSYGFIIAQKEKRHERLKLRTVLESITLSEEVKRITISSACFSALPMNAFCILK